MNRTITKITALVFAGTLGFGLQASAQDTKAPDPSSPSSAGQMQPQDPTSEQSQKHPTMTKAQHAFMKDCMTKAKQSNNGMSEADMHKSCKDQMKANDQSAKPVTPAN